MKQDDFEDGWPNSIDEERVRILAGETDKISVATLRLDLAEARQKVAELTQDRERRKKTVPEVIGWLGEDGYVHERWKAESEARSAPKPADNPLPDDLFP